ncbi:MAG: AMP-binding protein, partial [Myxococcota bacterium]
PNGPDWLALDLALIAEGAIGVPLYDRLSDEEIAALVADCGASLVLRAPDLVELLSQPGPLGEPAPREPTAPVTLVYTSGTSGEPKGAILTDAGLAFVVEAASDALARATGGDDAVFHYLPLCFAGSRIVAWTCLARGRPLTLGTDPTKLLEEVPAAAPTWFLNVPLVLERVRRGVDAALAQRPAPVRGLVARALRPGPQRGLSRWLADRLVFSKVRARLGPNLKFLVCGSAALSPETQRWFEGIGIPVLQVYGLTETTAIATMDDPRDARQGWVGRALPGVELRLVEGELQVRGPNVFAGYWNRPEATAAAFDGEWLRTGDQCELDDGRLAVVGRVRDVLVLSSGHNVAPEPLEAKLAEAPGVEQVVVLGHARPHLVALVVGDAAGIDLEAFNADLPHYRRIRAVAAIEPLTPESGLLTANRKLKRRVIADHYRAVVDALYG